MNTSLLDKFSGNKISYTIKLSLVEAKPEKVNFGTFTFVESMADLVWSIKNGDLDQVQEAFAEQKIGVNSEVNGRYPLHYAADYGQYDVLNYLIDMGANINLADKHGITPLLAAVWEGHTKCVELLIAKGATKNGKTPDGKSYIDVAEKEEIRNLLL